MEGVRGRGFVRARRPYHRVNEVIWIVVYCDTVGITG